MSGGHSGEAIPVPIPNTEVKLSNADDTAFRGGKVGSCQTFFYLNTFILFTVYFQEIIYLLFWQLPTATKRSFVEPKGVENPKKLHWRTIFFNGFPIWGKLPDFFFFKIFYAFFVCFQEITCLLFGSYLRRQSTVL